MLEKIALRNLARNKRRTSLALLVVAAGAASLLLTAGFMRESFLGLRDAFVRGGLGHLEVAPAATGERPEERAAPPSLLGWREARRAIEAIPHVKGATGAIVLQGLASKGDHSAPFVGAGLEPDREARMGLIVRLRSGRGLSLSPPREGEEEALLGLALARSLGARVGDVVTLTSPTPDGLLNALDVHVVGLVTTGVQDLDARFLHVHLVTAQRLLGTDAVSSIVVMLDDASETATVGQQIARRLAGHVPRLVVSDWQARAPFYRQVRSLYVAIFGFLGTIVLVLVTLSSSNTLLMAVLERIREIGALLAIGTSGGQIVRMILSEAAWLGLLGGGVGCALGAATAAVINALRIELPPPPGAVETMTLRLRVLPSDFLWVTATMVVVLSAAAVVPAVRALRLRIVEALAHV